MEHLDNFEFDYNELKLSIMDLDREMNFGNGIVSKNALIISELSENIVHDLVRYKSYSIKINNIGNMLLKKFGHDLIIPILALSKKDNTDQIYSLTRLYVKGISEIIRIELENKLNDTTIFNDRISFQILMILIKEDLKKRERQLKSVCPNCNIKNDNIIDDINNITKCKQCGIYYIIEK